VQHASRLMTYSAIGTRASAARSSRANPIRRAVELHALRNVKFRRRRRFLKICEFSHSLDFGHDLRSGSLCRVWVVGRGSWVNDLRSGLGSSGVLANWVLRFLRPPITAALVGFDVAGHGTKAFVHCRMLRYPRHLPTQYQIPGMRVCWPIVDCCTY
jgi:hypothetical protein